MNTNELVRLLVASGAVRVQGGRVKVDLPKVTGHWTNDGRHGWQRDGGGQDEQGQEQDSRD